MHDLPTTLGLAIVLFASTNVDDLFLLIAFFADPGFRPWQIVAGQLAGILALVAVSALGSMVAVVVSPRHVGLLGVVPVALGVVKLLRGKDDDGEDGGARARSAGTGLVKVGAIALTTIASGGDNVGVYVPVFAARSRPELVTIVAAFVVLTGVWCAAAHALVRHERLRAPVRRHAGRVTPFVFIALGVYVLVESESWRLLAG